MVHFDHIGFPLGPIMSTHWAKNTVFSPFFAHEGQCTSFFARKNERTVRNKERKNRKETSLMPSPQAKPLHVSSLQQELLQAMAHRTTNAHRLVKRAHIILEAL